MLDFSAIKQIPLTQVLAAKYGVALTFSGKYAKAKCPLPTHKQGDRDRNFNVNLEGNFWKCWSETCNEKAGGKGGDVINFVAVMEGCSQHEAAKKLTAWFNISENKKAAQPIAARPEKPPKETSRKDSQYSTSSNDSVKGYMQDVDAWFDALFARRADEDDESFLKRVRNGVKARLIQSFRNGKKVAMGLQPE